MGSRSESDLTVVQRDFEDTQNQIWNTSNDADKKKLEETLSDLEGVRKRRAPLDGGYGWVCVAAACVANMLSAGVVVRSSGILFVAIVDYFQTSRAETAWITAVLMLTTFFMAPLGGWLSFKFGTRPIVMLSGVLSGGGYILSYFVTEVWQLYLTIGIVTGVGGAMAFTPSLGHVGLYFEKRKILAIGVCVAGAGIGSFAAAPLTTFLLDEYGLRGTFLITGGIVLNLTVCGAFYRPLSFYDSRLPRQVTSEKVEPSSDTTNLRSVQGGIENNLFRNENENGGDKNMQTTNIFQSGVSERQQGQSCSRHNELQQQTTETFTFDLPDVPDRRENNGFDWSLLKRPDYWLVGISLMLMVMGFFNVVTVLLPVHCAALGIPDETYALFLSIMGGLDTVGRIFFGWFADLNLTTKSSLLSIFMFLSGILIVIVPTVGANEAAIASIAALFGITAACLGPLQSGVLVERIGSEKLQSALSLSRMFVGLPFLFSQPAAGYIFDAVGAWDIAFYYSGGAMMLGGMILGSDEIRQFVKKKKKQQKLHPFFESVSLSS